MKKNLKKQNKTKKAQEEPMICTTEYPVDIHFSPEELAEKSDQLVDSHRIINEIMMERKEAMSEFNKRLSGINKDISKLCSDLTKKFENKMATCQVRYDFDKGLKYILHPQTGDVIKEVELDLDDHRLYEEWKASKKREIKPVTLCLPAGEAIEVKDENIPNNDENGNEEGEDNE